MIVFKDKLKTKIEEIKEILTGSLIVWLIIGPLCGWALYDAYQARKNQQKMAYLENQTRQEIARQYPDGIYRRVTKFVEIAEIKNGKIILKDFEVIEGSLKPIKIFKKNQKSNHLKAK